MLNQPYVLAVYPGAPFKDVREYIAYAKENPGKIKYATAGAGSSAHLPGALLHYMADTEVTFVHYKRATQRMLDLTAGRVEVSPLLPRMQRLGQLATPSGTSARAKYHGRHTGPVLL